MTATTTIARDLRRRARIATLLALVLNVVAFAYFNPQGDSWWHDPLRWKPIQGIVLTDRIAVLAAVLSVLLFASFTFRRARLPYSAIGWSKLIALGIAIVGVIVNVKEYQTHYDVCVTHTCQSLAGQSTGNWIASYVVLFVAALLCWFALTQMKAAQNN